MSTTGTTSTSTLPDIVSPAEWAAARADLLAAEKDMTRARDALAARRRRQPMVEFGPFTFTGEAGEQTLLDVFEGRRQLIVYHFMHDPNWCSGCALFTDQVSNLAHLHARDTSLAIVSLTPWSDLEPFRRRMGWTLPFFSCGPDFADATGTPEGFGLSVFLREGDRVFRTYFTAGRGVEQLGSVWSFLDLTPLGRQEQWEDSPAGYPQTAPYQWWRLHDEY
ncbi:DUF899 family protein [Pseudonocardia xinjiangensis]|uniref:DUF899 family protein n=1 Tax=Pseudonocardia xinjiangensis TaxID=75289 RepID=UPI003D8F64D6